MNSSSSPPSGGEEKVRSLLCPPSLNFPSPEHRLARNRPQPAGRRPSGPARVPAAMLPPFWRAWTSETATVLARRSTKSRRHCSPRSPASARGRRGAHHRSWHEPLILWLALVGGPSNGKSPALEAMRRALAAVERRPGARVAARSWSSATPTCPGCSPPPASDRPAPAVARRARRLAGGARLQRPPPAGREVSALLAGWSPQLHGAGPEQPGHQPGRQPRTRRASARRFGAATTAAPPACSTPGRRQQPWRSLRELPGGARATPSMRCSASPTSPTIPLRPLGLSVRRAARSSAFDQELARMHQAGCGAARASRRPGSARAAAPCRGSPPRFPCCAGRRPPRRSRRRQGDRGATR